MPPMRPTLPTRAAWGCALLALIVSVMVKGLLAQAPAPTVAPASGATPAPATGTPPAAQVTGVDLVRATYTKYEYLVPMRDGVRLFTAVYTPKDASQRYPFL